MDKGQIVDKMKHLGQVDKVRESFFSSKCERVMSVDLHTWLALTYSAEPWSSMSSEPKEGVHGKKWIKMGGYFPL